MTALMSGVMSGMMSGLPPAMTSMITAAPSPAVIDRLGWTLVHFLWQGTLLGLLSASLLALLPSARAQARYLLACTTLLTMLAAPVVTFSILAPQDAAITARTPGAKRASARDALASAGTAGSAASNSLATHEASATDARVNATAPHAMTASSAMRLDRATSASPSVAVGASPLTRQAHDGGLAEASLARLRGSRTYRQSLAALESALPWLVQAWTLGICALSLRLAGGLALVARLRRRRLQPASMDLQQRVAALAQRLGVRRAIALRISAGADTPAVIGWLRPIVLLPASALAGLAPDQLEAVLAHELAHVRRHDYLVNLLQSMAETLLFYHPAVWYVSHRIRVEREHCCDDEAVATCGDVTTYASALADLEMLRHSVPGLAMTALGSRSSLLHRVRRLLAPSPRASSSWPASTALLAMTALVVSALAMRGSLAAAPQTATPAPRATAATRSTSASSSTSPLSSTSRAPSTSSSTSASGAASTSASTSPSDDIDTAPQPPEPPAPPEPAAPPAPAAEPAFDASAPPAPPAPVLPALPNAPSARAARAAAPAPVAAARAFGSPVPPAPAAPALPGVADVPPVPHAPVASASSRARAMSEPPIPPVAVAPSAPPAPLRLCRLGRHLPHRRHRSRLRPRHRLRRLLRHRPRRRNLASAIAAPGVTARSRCSHRTTTTRCAFADTGGSSSAMTMPT